MFRPSPVVEEVEVVEGAAVTGGAVKGAEVAGEFVTFWDLTRTNAIKIKSVTNMNLIFFFTVSFFSRILQVDSFIEILT